MHTHAPHPRHLRRGSRGFAAKTTAPAASIAPQSAAPAPSSAKPDLSQLSSLLKAHWKGNTPAPSAAPDSLAEGQIRTFKIVKLESSKCNWTNWESFERRSRIQAFAVSGALAQHPQETVWGRTQRDSRSREKRVPETGPCG